MVLCWAFAGLNTSRPTQAVSMCNHATAPRDLLPRVACVRYLSRQAKQCQKIVLGLRGWDGAAGILLNYFLQRSAAYLQPGLPVPPKAAQRDAAGWGTAAASSRGEVGGAPGRTPIAYL